MIAPVVIKLSSTPGTKFSVPTGPSGFQRAESLAKLARDRSTSISTFEMEVSEPVLTTPSSPDDQDPRADVRTSIGEDVDRSRER